MERKKQYIKIEKIGEGSFGKVFKVRHKKSKETLVMKEINLVRLSPKQKDEAVNEVRIISSLNNDFILTFKDAFLCEGI